MRRKLFFPLCLLLCLLLCACSAAPEAPAPQPTVSEEALTAAPTAATSETTAVSTAAAPPTTLPPEPASTAAPRATAALTTAPATTAKATAATIPPQTTAPASTRAPATAAATTTRAAAATTATTAPTTTVPTTAKPTTAPATQPPQTRSCTLSIECKTLLNHLDELEESKRALVPSNGVLLSARSVSFQEGETVFDVLQRTCRANGIQMEFSMTPVYHSAYIEGIGNLYEFDGGPLSGWMYSVNGTFPNVGSSGCALHNGDTVVWRYTCDLGHDLGGRNQFQ